MVLQNDEMYTKRDEFDGNDNLTVWTVCKKDITAEDQKCYTYEEAIDLAGSGRYNVWLLSVLSIAALAMAIDMFGFSLVVATCACDFNLTLAQKGIISSMPFIGAITMAYPWGYLSDTRGRRACLLVAMSACFVVSTLSSFSPNWIVMAILKLIGSSFCSSAQSITYSLLGECCGRRIRGSYMMLMASILMMGPCLYFGLGYFVLKLDFTYDMGVWGMTFRPWRLLTLLMAMPLGMAALGLVFCYESPKFLANQGKTEQALQILRKMYRTNRGNSEDFPVRKFILEEQGNVSLRNKEPLLQSIWNQTAPLFRPPLLMKTLQLYYLTAIIYGINNSFVMWFPFIINAFFSSYGQQNANIGGLCQLITDGLNKTSAMSSIINDTEIVVSAPCVDYLEDLTIYSGILHSLSFTVLNVIIARFTKWKKIVMITIFTFSAGAGIATNLTPEPISALGLFLMFLITAMGIGVVFSYFVDLYPTSYRGMVACLAVMVARASSLIGINTVGAVITNHCTSTFYFCTALLLSAVFVSCLLPPDKPSKKP